MREGGGAVWCSLLPPARERFPPDKATRAMLLIRTGRAQPRRIQRPGRRGRSRRARETEQNHGSSPLANPRRSAGANAGAACWAAAWRRSDQTAGARRRRAIFAAWIRGDGCTRGEKELCEARAARAAPAGDERSAGVCRRQAAARGSSQQDGWMVVGVLPPPLRAWFTHLWTRRKEAPSPRRSSRSSSCLPARLPSPVPERGARRCRRNQITRRRVSLSFCLSPSIVTTQAHRGCYNTSAHRRERPCRSLRRTGGGPLSL